jgi:endo-1,4-beta-mannosidase
MLIGATYSHRGIDRLKLDPAQSFQQTLGLGFDILRLAVYWDESQPSPRKYNFSAIQNLLDQCDRQGQKVVLSVGMKAPRWPEYYLPDWLKIDRVKQAQTPVLAFIETAVNTLKSHSAIAWWQVENEPLDGSGPRKWRIPRQLLTEEVALVRQLDSRPIHLNLWGDNVTQSQTYATAASLADSVGIDLYYRQPAKFNLYHGPHFNWLQFKWWRWQQHRRGVAKPLWITELQA